MAGIWLADLDCVRRVQWGSTHLWDIKFEDGPKGFIGKNGDWFPATTVSENIYVLETYSFNAGLVHGLELPKNTTPYSLTIEVADDVWMNIESWLADWVNNKILTPNGLAYIEDIVKKVHIAKITSKNELVSLSSYYVYPKGNLNFEGASESGQITHSVEFIVAGSYREHLLSGFQT